MKIYNTAKNKYGLVIGAYDYLVDRGISMSGTKKELEIEIKLWNFVAKIINKLNKEE